MARQPPRRQRTSKHPLDLDLMDLADHLRVCGLCRTKLSRMMRTDRLVDTTQPDDRDRPTSVKAASAWLPGHGKRR